MQLLPDQVARDWIKHDQFENPADAPEEVFSRGRLLTELTLGHPEFAWETIKLVVGLQPEDDLFCDEQTESQRTLCNLGAGPLEDLLAHHGMNFIERVESEARRDRRFFLDAGMRLERRHAG